MKNSSLYSGSICGVVGTTPPVATGKEEEEAEGGKRLCDLPVSLCKNRESYSIKSIVIGYHLGTVFFCKFAHLKSPGIQGFLESSLKGLVATKIKSVIDVESPLGSITKSTMKIGFPFTTTVLCSVSTLLPPLKITCVRIFG